MTTTASTHRRSAMPLAAQVYLLVVWAAAIAATGLTVSASGGIAASEWRHMPEMQTAIGDYLEENNGIQLWRKPQPG